MKRLDIELEYKIKILRKLFNYLLTFKVFDKIREKYPERFTKIRIIKGDVSQDDLGLCDNDKNELIENVTTIFHCAACVRFDQPLRDAINMNLLGTNRMLKLAELMTNLKVCKYIFIFFL